MEFQTPRNHLSRIASIRASVFEPCFFSSSFIHTMVVFEKRKLLVHLSVQRYATPYIIFKNKRNIYKYINHLKNTQKIKDKEKGREQHLKKSQFPRVFCFISMKFFFPPFIDLSLLKRCFFWWNDSTKHLPISLKKKRKRGKKLVRLSGEGMKVLCCLDSPKEDRAGPDSIVASSHRIQDGIPIRPPGFALESNGDVLRLSRYVAACTRVGEHGQYL